MPEEGFLETTPCAGWRETGSKSSMREINLHELSAKFAAGQITLPAIQRFHLFQYRMRPGEKWSPTTKSTKGTICVFVPFVAIPGKRPAAEFCKRLMDVQDRKDYF